MTLNPLTSHLYWYISWQAEMLLWGRPGILNSWKWWYLVPYLKTTWSKSYGDGKLACRRRTYHDDKLLQYEMCRPCSTIGKVGTCVTEFLVASMEGSVAHLLRWVLRKLAVQIWSGFIWLRMGCSGVLLWIWKWSFRFHKRPEWSSPAKQKIACKRGPCCVDCVTAKRSRKTPSYGLVRDEVFRMVIALRDTYISSQQRFNYTGSKYSGGVSLAFFYSAIFAVITGLEVV